MLCLGRGARIFIWASLLVMVALVLAGSAILVVPHAKTSTEAPRLPRSAVTTSTTSVSLMRGQRLTSRDGHSMVADVRFKVRMRLRAVLADILKDARPGGRLIQAFDIAKTNQLVNDALKEHYRTWVSREFPGCRIEFTRKNIYIHLPDNFGAGRAPVMEQMPIALVAVFHPIKEAGF